MDLCAYLKKIEPDPRARGTVGASATTTRACPGVRNALLKDLDTKTPQEALG
jgi:hypothetical protein